jgi:hypothetical protein
MSFYSHPIPEYEFPPVLDSEWLEDHVLWKEADVYEQTIDCSIDLTCQETQPLSCTGQTDDVNSLALYPPADCRTLRSSPEIPVWRYQSSGPYWPNQGPVEIPPLHASALTDWTQGPSPVCLPNPALERILVYTGHLNAQDIPNGTTSSITPVTTFPVKPKRKAPSAPRFPTTLGQFKARNKPVTKKRDTGCLPRITKLRKANPRKERTNSEVILHKYSLRCNSI